MTTAGNQNTGQSDRQTEICPHPTQTIQPKKRTPMLHFQTTKSLSVTSYPQTRINAAAQSSQFPQMRADATQRLMVSTATTHKKANCNAMP